ncbi:MAG: hypothetical protein R2854_21350 [Caldilineaceae bacterium]
MTPDFDAKLNAYAELIVKVGLNLQPGQRLFIGRETPFAARHWCITSRSRRTQPEPSWWMCCGAMRR